MLLLIITPFILLTLLSVAYQTLFDRKFMAAAQRRLGPSIVGIKGAGQPLTDGGKLFGKQTISVKNSNSILFQLSPVILFALSLFIGTLLPILSTVSFGSLVSMSQISITTNVSLIFIVLVLSLSTLTFLSAGWASFSKYAELGGVRGANQALGYELILTFTIIILILFIRSLDLANFMIQQSFFFLKLSLHFDLLMIFWISVLAETARVPFDLPESESELVAGYFTEYAGFLFALFFLAEYNNMLFSSFFISALFFSGWLSIPYNFFVYYSVNYIFLFCFIICILILFSLHRSVLARVRIDQLYYLNWKMYMPWLSFSFFLSFFFLTLFQLYCGKTSLSLFFDDTMGLWQLKIDHLFILASFSFIFLPKKSKLLNNNLLNNNFGNKKFVSSITSLDPEVLNMLVNSWKFSVETDLQFSKLLEIFDVSANEFFEYIKKEKIQKVYWLDVNINPLKALAFGIVLGYVLQSNAENISDLYSWYKDSTESFVESFFK